MQYTGICIIKNGSIEPLDEQEPIGDDNEVYEVLRIFSGKALFLPDHTDRWTNSMKATGREIPKWVGKLPQLIDWLIACNGIKDCDMRITASANGTIQCGFVETDFPSETQYANGVECQLLQAERATPSLKIFHSAMRHDAATQQAKTGAYESLLVNSQGEITEGSRSNVYFVDQQGVIHTAPDGTVLGGIMRKKVLSVCQDLGITIKFECVKASDIKSYVAAFLSSTPMRVLPINKIGDTSFDFGNIVVRKVVDGVNDLVKKQ